MGQLTLSKTTIVSELHKLNLYRQWQVIACAEILDSGCVDRTTKFWYLENLEDVFLHEAKWKIVVKLFITVPIHFYCVLLSTASSTSSSKSMYNNAIVDFELDLHHQLIDSQLWLNKTLWLMKWYMLWQSNRWDIIILWRNTRDIYEYEYHNMRHNPVKKQWRDLYEYLCFCVVMTCNI